jgi:aminopeptidase N
VSLSVATDGATTTVDIARTDALTDDPPVAMPVVLGFLTDDGRPLDVSIDGVIGSEHTIVLAARSMRVEVVSETPPVISPLRGYSAPVDLATDPPAQHLAVLLEHDPDAVAQWWASEELMIRAIDEHRRGGDDPAGATVALLADGLRSVLRQGTAEPMQLAQLLALPDEFMLGDREASIDVDGVASGLAVLRSRLGLALHDDLLDLLERTTDDSMGASPSDIATRSLVEPSLALLLATGSDEAIAAAERQLRSPNPTRAVRALAQLVHLDAVPIDGYVAETYARWQGAPKLLDRWLRAQSGSRRADTIERVAALRDGPLYDRNDRGRIMGLWFPFATRNRSVFHDTSGAGYRLFVDEVIELMPINAGVVIRLVGDLLQFKRFDDHRSALMRHELERMAHAPGMPDFAVGIVQGLLA